MLLLNKLAVVQLTDATHIVDAAKYISIVLLNLKAMLNLGLPHINVLSKIDLLKGLGADFGNCSLSRFVFSMADAAGLSVHSIIARTDCCPFFTLPSLENSSDLNLDFYTDVQDLSYLLPILDQQTTPKFGNLNRAMIDLIEDFNLVGFETLYVEVRSFFYSALSSKAQLDADKLILCIFSMAHSDTPDLLHVHEGQSLDDQTDFSY